MVLVVPILLMLMYIMVFSAKTMLLYGQRTIEARNGAYAIELYNGGNPTALDEFKQGLDEGFQTAEAELAEVEEALGSIGLSASDYIPDEVLGFLQQVPVQRYGYIPDDSKNFYNTMLRTTRDEMDDYSTTDDPEIVKEEKIKNLSSILDNEYSKSGYTVGVGVSAFVGALGKFHPFTGHFTMRNTHFADFATQLELHDYNLNNQEAIDNGYDLKRGYSVEMEAMLDPKLIFTTIFADPEPDPLETPPPFELPFPVPVDPTVGIVPGGGLPPGQWTAVNEGMTDRARAYQEQITGRVDEAYVVGGVKFDGVAPNTYIDAKGLGYATHVRNGVFQPYFQGADSLVQQARRQLVAAAGVPIEWHVAEEQAAVAMRNLLRDNGISGIEIIHVPAR